MSVSEIHYLPLAFGSIQGRKMAPVLTLYPIADSGAAGTARSYLTSLKGRSDWAAVRHAGSQTGFC
ncbi:hypothetical protein EJ06DRAFT_527941 [Trichodelitschia bisporula]|uniref:Uncharacterized protein n=1 Tax=Trichodelitschia bisporula TaxID=703511 RepID=A0A6G1I4R9_9PEZI|nr:hypothetical protein EJ06DRAFT_527941 [Trichodelitschia bisporula]